jgi:hypothetical protein
MIADKYIELYDQGYRSIDITGGEPTIHPNFTSIGLSAVNTFDEAHLYTADMNQYNIPFMEDMFTSINFGFHNGSVNDLPFVVTGIPVYAQIIHYRYTPNLPILLAGKNFSGLSINIDKHLDKVDFKPYIPHILNFSTRINDGDYCANDHVLMPDLTLEKGIKQYLEKNRR